MRLFTLTMVILIAGTFVTPAPHTAAQAELTWPAISLQIVVNGLDSPVHLTHSGDQTGRLFIVEQAGVIRIYQNRLLSTPFLDIHGRVRSPANGGGGEEGLLGLAFPPGFGVAKDYFYVYYTNLDGNNQVSRFHLSANPDQADPSGEERILLLPHPQYSNHNGGQVAFGPDGYLYIGTGDGGGGGDPYENAQNTASLLGKILRIDVEMGSPASPGLSPRLYLPLIRQGQGSTSGSPYRIPSDNPFAGRPGYRGEIWALGLRNPWRFSFDRQSGDLYIADVGQNAWEEVDYQPASSAGGENYGWDISEGTHCYEPPSGCDLSGLTLPIFEYFHQVQNGIEDCSITGGFVYRGSDFPTLQGIYFAADFCSGKIWGVRRQGQVWQSALLKDTPYLISTFGEDQAGELYLADYNGSIYRVISP